MAPLVLIASCHVATAPGEVVQLLLLGEEPWGSFGFALGVWEFWGHAWEEFRVPPRLLNLLFTAGKGEGGELGFLRVGHGCCSPLLPKKVPFYPLFTFPGSLGSGRVSSERGLW